MTQVHCTMVTITPEITEDDDDDDDDDDEHWSSD